MEPRDNLKAARDLASALRAAGWSEGAGSLPKSEALAAAARVQLQPPNLLTPLRSEGHCLIYGSGQTALDVGVALAEKLNLTVCLADIADALPAGSLPELIRGEITDAAGHCGAFRVTVRNMARLSPMSRQQFEAQGPTGTATIECETILDVSGRPSLFRGCEERDGYIRANPFDPLSLGKAMLQATELVGEFEKPRSSSSLLSCARIHAIAGLDAQTASTSALPALFRLMAIKSASIPASAKVAGFARPFVRPARLHTPTQPVETWSALHARRLTPFCGWGRGACVVTLRKAAR